MCSYDSRALSSSETNQFLAQQWYVATETQDRRVIISTVISQGPKNRTPIVPQGAQPGNPCYLTYTHNTTKPPAAYNDNVSHRQRTTLPGGLGDRKMARLTSSDAPPTPPQSAKNIGRQSARSRARNQHNQRHRRKAPPRHQLNGVVVNNATPAIQ